MFCRTLAPGIASDPDDQTVMVAPDYASLSSMVAPLVTAVCNGTRRYVISHHTGVSNAFE